MKEKLTHNLGLKLLALFFAVVLWIVCMDINDPISDRTFSGIQVQLINSSSVTSQGKTWKVVNSTDRVRVTVSGRSSVLNQLSAGDLLATADMSQMNGDGTVPISLTIDSEADAPVEIVDLVRDTVQLVVDDLLTRQMRIEVVQQGSLPDGYVVGRTSTDTNTMTISGPAAAVSQVARAVVEVGLDGSVSDIDMDAPIRLLDGDGVEVGGAEIHRSVDSVKTTITVLETRQIALSLDISGAPASGFMQIGEPEVTFAGREVQQGTEGNEGDAQGEQGDASGGASGSPSDWTVSVAGRAGALEELQAQGIHLPVSIEDAREDVTATFRVRDYLPSEVMLADASFDGTVTVRIPIEGIITRRYTINPAGIQLLNRSNAWYAETIADQTISVSLSGFRTALDSISEESLAPHIDLNTLTDAEGNVVYGEQEAEVLFLLPQGVTQENRVTARLRVMQMGGYEGK